MTRTVQQILACRYRPAQLDAKAMAQQLEEAEVSVECQGIFHHHVCKKSGLKSVLSAAGVQVPHGEECGRHEKREFCSGL